MYSRTAVSVLILRACTLAWPSTDSGFLAGGTFKIRNYFPDNWTLSSSNPIPDSCWERTCRIVCRFRWKFPVIRSREGMESSVAASGPSRIEHGPQRYASYARLFNAGNPSVGLIDQWQMNVLALQPVVMVQPPCIDERHITLAITGEAFFFTATALHNRWSRPGRIMCLTGAATTHAAMARPAALPRLRSAGSIPTVRRPAQRTRSCPSRSAAPSAPGRFAAWPMPDLQSGRDWRPQAAVGLPTDAHDKY